MEIKRKEGKYVRKGKNGWERYDKMEGQTILDFFQNKKQWVRMNTIPLTLMGIACVPIILFTLVVLHDFGVI